MAELHGAPENQIRRLGNWNSQAMENCYLSTLPRDAIRSLAGFSPDHRNYYIRRDVHRPSEALMKKVFPQIETIEEKMSAGLFMSSIATGAFLDTLKFFRRVLLQDAAVLLTLDEYRNHPIFQHAVFKSQEFLDFKGYRYILLKYLNPHH